MKRVAADVGAAAVVLMAASLVAGCEGVGPVETALSHWPTDPYRYTVIDVPGATTTQVRGINQGGDLAGTYRDASGAHAFILWRGATPPRDTSELRSQMRIIDVPSATATEGRGINNRGDVVGFYSTGGRLRGFLLGNNGFEVIEYPAANGTRLWGINDNGDIAGEYQAAAGGAWRGFTRRDGVFKAIDVPNANMSAGYGIDYQGAVVGHFTVPGSKMLGYQLDGGTYTYFDHPGSASAMSCAEGIGSQGEVVGHYLDLSENEVYGWVWRDGFVARLEVPGATGTYATSIAWGAGVAGYYFDVNGVAHGFVAEPLNLTGR